MVKRGNKGIACVTVLGTARSNDRQVLRNMHQVLMLRSCFQSYAYNSWLPNNIYQSIFPSWSSHLQWLGQMLCIRVSRTVVAADIHKYYWRDCQGPSLEACMSLILWTHSLANEVAIVIGWWWHAQIQGRNTSGFALASLGKESSIRTQFAKRAWKQTERS